MDSHKRKLAADEEPVAVSVSDPLAGVPLSPPRIPFNKRTKSVGSDGGHAAAAPLSFEQQLGEISSADDKSASYEDLWPRPALPSANPKSDSIVFQQIEVDDYIGPAHARIPHKGIGDVSIIRMYGVTENGNSVMCHVHGYLPYFYVSAPKGFQQSHIPAFFEALNNQLKNEGSKKPIVDAQLVMKQSLYHFQGLQLKPYIQVTLAQKSQVASTKRILDSGLQIGSLGRFSFVAFESNMQHPLKFMIDTDVRGANWVEIPKGHYTVRKAFDCHSTAQIEIDCMYDEFVSHKPEGEWSKIAPLRILSFDIECAGRKGIFPEPQHDSVIQIANMVTIQGQKEPFIRNVFTLKSCANIIGTHILSFENEGDMLLKWSKFVQEVDPDIITGYNIQNFDIPYLIDRAKTLGVADFPYMGRIKETKTVVRDSHFQSKALGARDNKTTNLEGRLQFDVLQIVQRDHKLRSYTLNSVCAHFLAEQKEDVHYSIITDLQNGNDETRRRLAVYCLKDAYLPQRLLDKLMCIINYTEMARVTGVPFNYLLTRGQQIKVLSQLYRKAKVDDYIIPHLEPYGTEDQYDGAVVIEPERGYYEVPIATLDFTSLYPSIMMAHNLCYCTYIEKPAEELKRYNLTQDDIIRTPSGDHFVKSSVRKGLLPTILEDLLAARKRAKSDMKKETDPFKRAVLDGRQLALKISANSVYGFTGATIGKLPLLAISSSVTAFGRDMINETKKLVEAKYTIQNGYAHDAKVVYGDTDSVMVKFGVETVGEAMELGREAAGYVTTHFIRPINLDFEKVYFPYLLINKKRYAGLYWTKPEKHDKLDAKGIETVRRDSCRLVSNVINTCLNMLLIDRNKEKAEEYVKNIISDLLQNRVDISQLVISKALGKAEYAGKQAHAELAERMRKRDAGSAPSLGDRVSYVIVKGSKDAAAYEKAEDPIFVLENNLPIDTKYYLDNQLSKPLLRIFEPVLGDRATSLLTGDHTRVIQVAAPTTGVLMKFAVRKATCMGCKVPLKKGESTVCMHCKPREAELYVRQVATVNELETRFARLWTQCQRCQGSLHQDVICTSQDCPIFYMRKKVQKEMTDASSAMKRFEYVW
ncbi:DNA polymerase family B-domain-containing protein [Polychytrium aggregatum]|uniref:DNA polymerase family B-domain-containing protein n=1 Tax=Polychytrium aggregatum TaxID=110093 RepID=UPI0022FE6271|nr:DNA polymerase family B-domain-containing protein [Polychytrium aggregatum]KAI9201944.1 DNA polymerase family B-domain-containing protein [Polychytrium aggregatum]